jgi:hypothetical protein
MKLGNLELSNWYGTGQEECVHNFWRRYMDEEKNQSHHIGLICCPNVDTFRKDPRLCYWKVTNVGEKFVEFQELFNKINGHRSYSYDELEQAKKDIDEFLIKMDKLLVFV